MPKDGVYRLLSQLELTRLTRLNVGSRFTVEGQLQGAHASPMKGFSIEFADYRQYVPGDDLRHLDWRAFARRERLYIKRYEDECNLRLHLLVDASASMAYSSGELSKYRCAARLAAALAYVTVGQQDSVGLTVFNHNTEQRFAARSGSAHLRTLANCLAEHTPASTGELAERIHHLAESMPRRALVVVVSDLYDDIDDLRRALSHLRRRKHDVIVYHVLDRAELDFPFRDLGKFEDLETGSLMVTNPRAIRRRYQEIFADFLNQARAACKNINVDYQLVTTDHDLLPLIRQHLQHRALRR